MRILKSPAARTWAGIVLLALMAAACSGGAAGSPRGGNETAGAGTDGVGAETALPDSGDVSSTPSASPSGPVTGHVGDKLTFTSFGGFSQVEATLVKVFDPAIPANSSTSPMPSGAHWVGVEITIDNHSPDFGSESSVVDAIASDGSTLTTDDVYQGFSRPIDAFEGCTQTGGGEQDVQPFTHCEAFAVLDGQALTQVGVKVGGAEIFSSLVPSDQAVWILP